jgi:pimeloyl-ACP methyl ester carboxylesterase
MLPAQSQSHPATASATPRVRRWEDTVERRQAVSADGTRIAYDVVGEGTRAVVLANGLGGRLYAWEPVVEALWRTHRIITWDYRGLFDSGSPASLRRLSVEHHVADLISLLDAEQLERAVLIGWSMGVQVALDAAATHPGRVAGLVLVNGTYGHVLSTGFQPFFSIPFLPKRLHAFLEILRARPELAGHLATVTRAAELPTYLGLRLLVGQRADALVPIVRRYFDDVLGPSFLNYLRLFQELDAHSVYHLLPEIDAPALVICGLLDSLTPAHQSREIARRLPHAELIALWRSSHFSVLERPEVVVPAIERFLGDRARY